VEYIDVPLRSSARLALILAVAHAAALVAAIAMPAAWWLRLVASSLILVGGTIMVRRSALLKASDSIVGLRLSRDGSCQLLMRNQRLISGQLLPGWFASPLMVVVQVACPGQRLRRSITVLPDAAERDILRRLRIFLRFAVEPLGRNK
jgi:toxin CptA